MLVVKRWSDEELEDWNDASAAAARDVQFVQINPSSFNALVCEVQAWRRTMPLHTYEPGPNLIFDKELLKKSSV